MAEPRIPAAPTDRARQLEQRVLLANQRAAMACHVAARAHQVDRSERGAFILVVLLCLALGLAVGRILARAL